MNKKILIVVSNYYKDIAEGLHRGAVETLKKSKYNYETVYVPGSFEISLAIKYFIKKNKYDGYIALGCILKGQTYHFNLLSNECARAINSLILEYTKPIGFGVLTCNNIKEARARSIRGKKNKGKEAALACLQMVNLLSSKNK